MRTLTYCLLSVALLLTFSCSKEISLENSGAPVPPTEQMQWQFEDSLGIKQGNVDTAYIANQGAIEALFLDGTTEDGQARIMINVVAEPLVAGTYSAENVSFAYYTGQDLIYFNDPSVGEFSITITSIDTAKVSGTFSGVIVDTRTGITSIKNGAFSANINSVPPGGTSEGTLVCDNIQVMGDYIKGEDLNATHYIEFDVNVTTPGSFTISTETVNGISYDAQGEFPNAGLFTVQLGAFGTPLESEQSQFVLTYGNSSCTFTVDVKAAADSLVDAPDGLLSAEEKTFGTVKRDDMKYWASNKKIGEIQSTTNPTRKLFYDANGRLTSQEFWMSDGLGGTFKDHTYKYSYDGSGNVAAILLVGDNGEFLDSAFRFTYNAVKAITSKTVYSNGTPTMRADYTYVNGNIVKISYTDNGLTKYVDSVLVDYDTRNNKIRDIHTQFYFIDMANVLEDTHQNEIFYFSDNYPTKMTLSNGTAIDVEVTINPNFVPTEIFLDGQSWFKYYY